MVAEGHFAGAAIAVAEPALFVIVEPPLCGTPHGVPLKQVSGQRLARLGRTLNDQGIDHRRPASSACCSRCSATAPSTNPEPHASLDERQRGTPRTVNVVLTLLVPFAGVQLVAPGLGDHWFGSDCAPGGWGHD